MASLIRVAPELPATDMTETLRYYETKLGFEVKMTIPSSEYAIVERNGVALHLFKNDPGQHSPVSIHIFASGLDELFEEFRTREAEIVEKIVRQPWGNRDFRVQDPSGNIIKFTGPNDGK